jgi:carotenoid 1,2-hydratase
MRFPMMVRMALPLSPFWVRYFPWYAFARRGGGGDPLNHCCMHVALYGKPARWAMTDRPRGALRRGADFLQIGPSAMRWDGSKLVVDLAEVTAPVPGKLRGRVTLYPEALSHRAFRLDGAGRHHWQPIAPRSRVEVAFDNPALRWSGFSYFDTQYRYRTAGRGFPVLGLVPRAHAGSYRDFV